MTRQPSFDAFFFDFDGVLADSVSVKTAAFGKLFLEFGEDISSKVVAHHLENGGMSRFDKFRHYYIEFLGREMTPVIMDSLCQRFSQLVVDEVVASAEIPGAGEFLERWSQRVPCYVISATPQEEIELIVERRGMLCHFAQVLGSPTRKGEHVAEILRRDSCAPSACVFFGDAMSDLKAAESCGVPFVGIAPDDQSSLIVARPDIVWFHDFIELDKAHGVLSRNI